MPQRSSRAPLAPVDKRDLVEGLGKGLRLIEAFDEDHPQLNASEAAERAGLTRTAARRYLLSLVHYGYAATDGRQFWLSPRVLRLGESYLGTARLPRIVQPFIQRVSAQIGHTVNVSVLDGHEIVYVARSSPPRWVTIGYNVGVRIPAHVVTPGYIALSRLDDAALDAWIAEHDFVRFTPWTTIDPVEFRAQVQQARLLEYWHTESSLDPGLRGMSVALLDRKGRCVGAVGSTMPMTAYRDGAHMLEVVLQPLQEAARSIRPLL
jgi:IclR family transcriptional regulator, pca regulon regulatory protein